MECDAMYPLQEPRIPLVQYWHSPKIPSDVAELMQSFHDHNLDMEHLNFSAFRSCAVPAMQADYFRYCAALALGGICVDADFRCLQPLASISKPADSGLLLSFPGTFSPRGLLSVGSHRTASGNGGRRI